MIKDRLEKAGRDVCIPSEAGCPLLRTGEADARIELRTPDRTAFQNTIAILDLREVLLGIVERQLDGVELGIEI